MIPYRGRAPRGLQAKGSKDTALRASPWPSRMAVDQVGRRSWSGSAEPMRLGCDHSTRPTARLEQPRFAPNRASGGGTARARFDPRGQSIPELSCEARSELKALDRKRSCRLVDCSSVIGHRMRARRRPAKKNGLRQGQRPRMGRSVHCEPRFCQESRASMFRTGGATKAPGIRDTEDPEWAEAQIMRALDG